MRTSSKKPSERHEVVQMINLVSMRELRKDLEHAKLLSLLSSVLTIGLYFIGTGYKVAAFCTILACVSTKIIESALIRSRVGRESR